MNVEMSPKSRKKAKTKKNAETIGAFSSISSYRAVVQFLGGIPLTTLILRFTLLILRKYKKGGHRTYLRIQILILRLLGFSCLLYK